MAVSLVGSLVDERQAKTGVDSQLVGLVTKETVPNGGIDIFFL